MKRKSFFVLSAFALLSTALVGCDNPADSSSVPASSSDTSSSSVSSSEEQNPIIIAEAIGLATEAGEAGTSNSYVISGKIKSIISATYGQMVIEDSTGELEIYGVYDENGLRYDKFEEIPTVGDTITLKGKLKTYNDKPEMDRATMLSFERGIIEEDDYTEMTLAAARAVSADSLVKVTGKVANFNVNSSHAKIGFWIVDGTSSMYVYDASACAGLEIGNTITVLAKKAYFVIDTEKDNAQKWGYKGANQLVSARVIENDNKVTSIDYSWAKHTTIKNIINTDITEDITSLVYDVNALIKKAPGSGFVNYYINDFDGLTGSYVYSQANGSDLSFLESFDGKICNVKLVAINAKSTSTGCIWRFYPIQVTDENFTWKAEDTPNYVLEYHVKDIFNDSYDEDPSLEVPTSVSSELLNFKDATVEYSSSDSSIISFAKENDKTYMHTGTTRGTATITATARYGSYFKSWQKEITYAKGETFDTISIASAIAATPDTEVIVEGVVAGSYTNKNGFFLIDETGTIAVMPTDGQTTCNQLSIGNRVVVKGTRKTYVKAGDEAKVYGQIQIESASVLKNYYGNEAYSTDSFIKNMTIAEIYEEAKKPLNPQPKAYRAQAKVALYTTAYSSVAELMIPDDESKYIQAYSSSGAQYAWLTDAFLDKVVTVDFMLMMPNTKTMWRCIPFSATDGEKTVYNTLYLKG